MFIPATNVRPFPPAPFVFQSLDWVDVYSGPTPTGAATKPAQFQSLDWVDVYSGNRRSRAESS